MAPLVPSTPLTQHVITLALAGAGVAVFWALDLPLPFLFGPMIACLIAAVAGVRLRAVGVVGTAARTVFGVAVGSAITPDVVGQLPQMAASVAFIPLYVATIAVVGVPFFHKVAGYDFATAWYAAMPGGLQEMVLFGAEAGGNARALALIHTTRVLIIVTLAPIVMIRVFGVDLSSVVGEPASAIPLRELGLMVLSALIGWKGGARIGLFGAAIIGPLVVSALLALSGVTEHRPPAEAILAAQFLVGLGVGVGYVGVTMTEIRRDILSGVAFVLILAALAFAFAEIVVLLDLARPIEGFLAFAPGGQAEMTIIALAVGADLGFVVVHHLTRLVIVITAAPLVARLLGRRGGR